MTNVKQGNDPTAVWFCSQVVLASLPNLESGFARQLFVEWAGDPRNAIVFTQRGEPGSLAAALQVRCAPQPDPYVFSLSACFATRSQHCRLVAVAIL